MVRLILAQYFWYFIALLNSFAMGMHAEMFSRGKGGSYFIFMFLGAFVVWMALLNAEEAEDKRGWLNVQK